MFGGKGMGGGSGGGGMLRTVGRAVTSTRTTGVAAGGALQEPISSSANTHNTSSTTATSPTSRTTHKPGSSTHLSLSSTSSPFASHNIPISAASGVPTWPPPLSQCDEFDWVAVDGVEDEKPHGYFDDFVLGPVPSKDEVQDAVSALQQVFDPARNSKLVWDKYAFDLDKDVADQVKTPTGSELDWMEPSPHLCNSRTLQPHGSDRVYDAFHLLHTEPSVQKMVISLSSDKAVWDAVMNNEVVRELRDSYYAVEKMTPLDPDESSGNSDDSNEATNILRWIFDNTKAKFMEAINKITKLMNNLFQSADDEKTTAGATDPFKEKLKSSFLLSVMVLLVVVLGRANKA
ncbi:uncharacterized protein LOC132189900 isoform X4 [Corylus avellana]|uniref:uncharacterized protein LOC132189900 isoform X4 n=1 Tax=Corylus avellana TaxID=13451 RepID=UPI00286BC248|nr:uncharacterized protein LOC132189900 isoform X4 [Corylus avellana]